MQSHAALGSSHLRNGWYRRPWIRWNRPVGHAWPTAPLHTHVGSCRRRSATRRCLQTHPTPRQQPF